MTMILAFIVANMGFLWSGARFRIVGSEISTVNGGDALLTIESDVLRLRFVCDRGQLFLDFQAKFAQQQSVWFSVDLVRRLFLGRPESSGVLDDAYAVFIRENLPDIERCFDDANWSTTYARLKELKTKRAKEMFG